MNTRYLVIFLALNGLISVAIGYKQIKESVTESSATDSNTNSTNNTSNVIDMNNTNSSNNVPNNNNINPNNLNSGQNNLGFINNGVNSHQPTPVAQSVTTIFNDKKNENIQTNNNNNNDISIGNTPFQNNSSNTNIKEDNKPNPNAQIKIANNTEQEDTNKDLNKNNVCTSIGPMDFNSKNTMEVILKQDKNINSLKYNSEQKPVYEVYWNLGKDRETAENLLQKQKNNGTMSDSRFIMVQNDEKDWVVPITEINSTLEVAKNTAIKLASTANKSNIGGKWNYRTMPTAYFYTISNFDILDSKTRKSIDVMINANKNPCSI